MLADEEEKKKKKKRPLDKLKHALSGVLTQCVGVNDDANPRKKQNRVERGDNNVIHSLVWC